MLSMNLKMNGGTGMRLRLRRLGWEIHRSDPGRSLGEHLWSLFPELAINCVLDVGARVGEYGQFIRRNGYSGHIISFEPIRENFDSLVKTCQADGNWTAHNYALGRGNTTAKINVMNATQFSSFLQPRDHRSQTFASNRVARTEAVAVKRLDTVFDDITRHITQPRVYLKMRAQGWDLEVIEGAEGCLESVAAMQSEMSVLPLYEGAASFKDAITQFEGLGFAISGIFNGPHHDDLRLAEFDCVMLRPANQRNARVDETSRP